MCTWNWGERFYSCLCCRLCYDLLSSYDGGRSRANVEIDFPKFGFLKLLHRPVIVRNCDCGSQGPLSSEESQSGEVTGADMKEVMSTFCRPSLKSSLRESPGKLRMLSRPESNVCLLCLSALILKQYTQTPQSCPLFSMSISLVWYMTIIGFIVWKLLVLSTPESWKLPTWGVIYIWSFPVTEFNAVPSSNHLCQVYI
jgi:hypothetical protein